MVSVEDIVMCYGTVRALNHVSFTARKGRVLGLLGPNGAGKTTLLKILTTFIHPLSGTARVEDCDILSDPLTVRTLIGYLPENVPLYPEMLVEEYLLFIAGARGLDEPRSRWRIDWVRETCGLRGVWKHPVREISKGYRQRVGLAQALLHDPPVLILDEVTTGLDPLQIIEIRRLIRDLAQRKTVIFSTHILQEAEALADEIVILNEGRVIVEGPKEHLLRGVGGHRSLETVFLEALLPKEKIQGETEAAS